MTYRELLQQLQELSGKQLDRVLKVQDVSNDEVHDAEFTKETEEQDVHPEELDRDHPVIYINW